MGILIMRFVGRVINGSNGIVEGIALVSKKRISFLGDVDPDKGIVRDPKSDIQGRYIGDKILIFRGGRGSTVGASVIYALKKNGHAPKVLVTVEADPVVIAGSIFSDIPMVVGVDERILELVKSDQKLIVLIKGDVGEIRVSI